MKCNIFFCMFVFLCPVILTAMPRFPLKISGNKRYFVDQDGKPFLYHADTSWQIFTQLTAEESVENLIFRKSQGFNTIHVQRVISPPGEDLVVLIEGLGKKI